MLAARKLDVRRLKGRGPVWLEPAYPLAPHPVFESPEPLLLLVQSATERTLAFRWRGGRRVEKLEPVWSVRAVEMPASDYRGDDVVFDVDVYRFDIPLEELVIVYLRKIGKEIRAMVYPHESKKAVERSELEALLKALEEVLGVKASSYGDTFAGLEPSPFFSFRLKVEGRFHEKRHVAAAVQPGWVTIIGPPTMIAAYDSEDGEKWFVTRVREEVLPYASVAHVPSGGYFLAVAYLWPRPPWPDDRVSYLLGVPIPEREHHPIPVAWRLPSRSLPPELKHLLLKEFKPEQVERLELIIREVGEKWP